MGFVKRQLEQQVELRFLLTDVSLEVCCDCLEDEALAKFGAQSKISCAFCGIEGTDGINLEDLFAFMAECILVEYDDPLNGVGWDKGWVGANVFDTEDLLGMLDEPLRHPALREAFIEAFDDEWCQRHPYSNTPDERLLYSWEDFADYVRHTARYLFLQTGRKTNPYEDLINPADMLAELETVIHDISPSIIKVLPRCSQLCRARKHPPTWSPKGAKDVGSPPTNLAQPNRMSPSGISMFYGADREATAVAEVRPTESDSITMSTWRTSSDLNFLDLSELPPVPSLFNPAKASVRAPLAFLHRFSTAIAEPVRPGGADAFYVPTQVLTEYVRHVMRTSAGEAISAIKYPSSIDVAGSCWVIFVDSDRCVDEATGDHLQLVLEASRSL